MRRNNVQPSSEAGVTADLSRFIKLVSEGAAGPYAFVQLLGMQTVEWPKIVSAVNRGLPYRTLEHLRQNTGLPESVVFRWIQLAPRTADRRKREGRLEPEESDRLLRAARVFGKALELFEGNRDYATEWLSSAQPALGGAMPLQVSESEVGAREVEDLLGRLEHGVYS